MEERFIVEGIPYDVVGGVNFYARREIKDMLAYLKTVDNGQDDLQVRRIINVPKRGIGATTVSRVQQYADETGISFYDALRQADQIPGLRQGSVKALALCDADTVAAGKAGILYVKAASWMIL